MDKYQIHVVYIREKKWRSTGVLHLLFAVRILTIRGLRHIAEFLAGRITYREFEPLGISEVEQGAMD